MPKVIENLVAWKLSNDVFFFMFRIEKKENIMAKYLDQAGAQYLAEALMNSTKTVGGQTIWGSGNIEAGGMPTITISSKSDIDTYKTVLENDSPKKVVFNATTIDLGGEDLTIRNAIFAVSTVYCTISNGGKVLFSDCKTGATSQMEEGMSAIGVCLYINSVTTYIVANCNFLIKYGVFLGNKQPIDASECKIYSSVVRLNPVSAANDSLRMNGAFIIESSYCVGFYFSSTSTVSFYLTTATGPLGMYGINTIMDSCDFSVISNFNNGTDVSSVRFIHCRFGDISIGNVFNVTQSIYATSLSTLYAGPTTRWPATEYGFNEPWSDF